ncbi:MAG: hypothetical protein ABI619_02805, partial [Betaproteobacteria bacterium]
MSEVQSSDVAASATTMATETEPEGCCDDRQLSPWMKWFSFDNRFLAPALITCILLGGQLTFGILESWTRTLLAIGIAMLIEMVLGKWMVGKFPHLASAYISGISVGILIRSPHFWPY